MSKLHFEKLLTMMKPFLKKKRARALNPELRPLITLRYLATGDLYFTFALAFRVEESTVRAIVKEVCGILVTVLQPVYLSPPEKEDWRNNVEGVWARWNMPNCLGSIDGKHIRLSFPSNSDSLFFSYKKYYNIGSFGGNSDGGIFNDSNIGINLNNIGLNIPKGDFNLPNSELKTSLLFISDDAFKLSKRMLKPYSGENLENSKKILNYRISRARRTVESTFGILASKWRILHTALCVLPATANVIVYASVCVHNFILKQEQRYGHKDFSNGYNSNIA
ncbi:uncharacterized protein [Prorops nasuta]|uniref:uncharacterized protein n=1 Tax=Prorops nasuta TaxID=863751 RepID=UPI0034CD6DB6